MFVAKRSGVFVVLFVTLLECSAVPLAAQSFPPRPGQRDFILDQANLIAPQDKEQIRSLCDKLLQETRAPIIVVTIPSLARYRAQDIEVYARALFDNWGIGSQANNSGMLLLVSLGDRKARIELGAAWAHLQDNTAQMIMQEIIVPNFKQGNYSAGILQGVQGLETMARGKHVTKPVPWWHPVLFWGLIILGIGAAVSLIRSGRAGCGWALLAASGLILVGIVVGMLSGRGSGRSFGGGSGGGGGATGSW